MTGLRILPTTPLNSTLDIIGFVSHGEGKGRKRGGGKETKKTKRQEDEKEREINTAQTLNLLKSMQKGSIQGNAMLQPKALRTKIYEVFFKKGTLGASSRRRSKDIVWDAWLSIHPGGEGSDARLASDHQRIKSRAGTVCKEIAKIQLPVSKNSQFLRGP